MNNTMSMKSLPDLLIIDFETNGATLPNGKLDNSAQLPTEVAALRVVDGEITSMFNSLVEYTGEWTPHLSSSANHHTPAELRKGMPESIVAEILAAMAVDPAKENHPVIVAYSALFDLEVMYRLFERAPSMYYEFHEEFKDNVQFIDPLTIARERKPYPHKLGDMCKVYGVELPEAHRAMDDCMALYELFMAMHKEDGYPDGVLPYLNVAGYKAQYGEPLWVPKSATLKEQGNVTVWHNQDGTKEKRIGAKPGIQRLVPAKGNVLQKRVPGGVPKVVDHPKFEKFTLDDIKQCLGGGHDGYVMNPDIHNGFREGNPYHNNEVGITFLIKHVFTHPESSSAWLVLEYNGQYYAYDIPY